ncbi:hypothetical protein [Metabacillus elymi]|uniref:Uncharacterized protein n=1 Tax=Metabacillus elymi TaxID=2745198 RepID=A0ABX6S6K3_9BACI|nr:hypothetical protein [Metabacillus sp. KUDC1714]QNF29644.1 hypothetical protein HUW50_20405 [Metabacillus sp. KUDC1714]
MSRLYLFGILFLFFVPLSGCSSNSHTVDSNEGNELINENSINENSARTTELSEKENVEEIAEATLEERQEKNIGNNSLSTPQQDSVSQEEMELLKETLRTYIFDEYMGSSDYVYAKGVNWTENFYDNLIAEEIWNVIEEYKEMNNGEEGTLFDQASYLSVNAPIKDNWEELFLENWNKSPYADDNEIETMIDKGDSVWIYTDTLPYTGEKDNYPFITLFKRTGFWHG